MATIITVTDGETPADSVLVVALSPRCRMRCCLRGQIHFELQIAVMSSAGPLREHTESDAAGHRRDPWRHIYHYDVRVVASSSMPLLFAMGGGRRWSLEIA